MAALAGRRLDRWWDAHFGTRIKPLLKIFTTKSTKGAPRALCLLCALCALCALCGVNKGSAADQPLLTVAEKSGYRATSHHQEVVDFCERLAKLSPNIRLAELGTSFEGRKLPLLILADPPIATPEEARKSGKLIVYAQGNIHAGEVDGKEALLMLARELATPKKGTVPLRREEQSPLSEAKDKPLLRDLILVFAPIFNADGNERFSKTNRPGQVGPEEGMGVRQNAQGLDLNRDFVKLESPEVRALVRFLNQWDPAVVIDTHTTDGSYHRYTITYEGPRILAGDARIITFVRDEMLPDVGRRLEQRGGYKSFFYGNFSRDHTRWETVPGTPRYGIHYVGLRNRIAILSESYSYAPYRERIFASRDFVHSILEYTAENKDKIRSLLSEARDTARREVKSTDTIALRQKAVPMARPVKVLGFVEGLKNGKRVATEKLRDYELQYLGGGEPILSVRRPYAYLFPANLTRVVENLQRHGVEADRLREDMELDVEVYRIEQITRAERPFQNHHLLKIEAAVRKQARRVPTGTVLVRTAQPLGALAAYLLEPQAEDGLCTWNFFDEQLEEGQDFPVLRLPDAVPITTTRIRPLPEKQTRKKSITLDAVYGSGNRPNLNGSPVSVQDWLDEEDFLQVKAGRLYKVQALSGRLQPFYDPAKMAEGLASLPGIGKAAARELARSTRFRMDPARTGALLEHNDDLYFARFDGAKAARLTKTPGKKELASFSPDGQFVAFVRDHNLYVVDLATQTERALTADNSGLVSNGKADWVYFEEVFDRHWQAYWWSPDSKHVAFLRFDDKPVHPFTVIDQIPLHQRVETTSYPNAGDPNPLVKLGIVSIRGGPVRWAKLGDYSETASLIVRAGWMPDSQNAYCYIQDRAQTWLDFCTVSRDGGKPNRLFRETTKAWVDDPGPPTFLKDGSFLLLSERTGWKHLYHFAPDGTLKKAISAGPWEVRTLHVCDEPSGWICFSGTHDSPIASNLYRVRLDGSGLERLTHSAGEHQVKVSPTGKFFIDSHSSHGSTTQIHLYRSDGSLGRTLDTNPVFALEEYQLGKLELVQIRTPDGFILEGSLLKPADFEPGRRYPVWFMTYGGPHAPTVRDSWSPRRANDEVLAHLGFLVFRCDPRSASGKGACSTWTAYRQLGVQELKDIESAIGWLKQYPFVDASRIGMSGHSYGGFLTAYALTHSKLFAAGIAASPVTDWHNYDSIYTERYMNTPQENPDGYRSTSVVQAARNLHGKLLLVHGLMDDNVHLQNSAQLLQALQRTDKDFEVMFYPRARHGISGKHYQKLMVDFMRRTLGDAKPELKAADQ
jgi:dipeptidyl aminopeptidase/acylaminoacyl peptidase